MTGREHTRTAGRPPPRATRADLELPGAGEKRATGYRATGYGQKGARCARLAPASRLQRKNGRWSGKGYGLRATGYGQKGALRALATAYSLEPTASATSDSTSISFVSCGTVFVETMRRAPAPRSCSMASSAKRAWTAIQVTS